MLNFRKVTEFLFKSFDISGANKVIQSLEKDGYRFLILIKRHWIYGVIHSWVVIAVLIIAIFNAYLLFSDKQNTLLGSIIAIFLLLNVGYWIYIIIHYLHKYYKLHGSKPIIEDIYTCIRKSKKSADIFTKFFNQTVFVLIILVGITGFSTISAISHAVISSTTGFSIGAINIILLMVQLALFSSYLITMINQEMDYRIVHNKSALFYDQRGFLSDSQSMNADKIRAMNTKYPGVIGSFFNYGSIIILTEGDQHNAGEMSMDYVGDPNSTVGEIQKIFKNTLEEIEKEVNVMLKKFKLELGVDDIESNHNKEKLKVFLQENDLSLQELYKAGDDETKREIQELYSLIQTPGNES